MIKYSQFPDISKEYQTFPWWNLHFSCWKSLKSPSSTRLPMRARSAASFAARARRQRRRPRHRGRRLAVARWGWIDQKWWLNGNHKKWGSFKGIIQGSCSSQTSHDMDRWSGERSQREKERERESEEKEDQGIWKGRKIAKHCVFFPLR